MSKVDDFFASFGNYVDKAIGRISRSSPAYVERIKAAHSNASKAVNSAIDKLATHLEAKEAAALAKRKRPLADPWDRLTDSTLRYSRPKAESPQPSTTASSSTAENAAEAPVQSEEAANASPDRATVAKQLAGVYWLRKLESDVYKTPLITKDLFYENDEPMNKLIEEAIRAQEPVPGTTPAKVDAQLAATEEKLQVNDTADAADKPTKS